MNGKYKILANSVIGKYHIKNNIPNQDAFFYKVNKNFLVASVADGMGSRKFSQIGSSALVKLVSKLSRTFYKNKISFEKKLYKEWIKAITPYKANDCLTTLIFIIIKNKKIYLAKVGDGTIVLIGKKDIIIDDEKSFSNLTTAFSLDKLSWQEFSENEIEAIFLATDGVSDDIKDKIGFLKGCSKYFFKYNRKKEFINMLKNWQIKGSFDDKTLVCIKRVK